MPPLRSANRFGARPALPLWATLAYVGAIVALVTTLVGLSEFRSEPPDRLAANFEVDDAAVVAPNVRANAAPKVTPTGVPDGVPGEADADWVEEPQPPTF
jgi:hypothetical protein